MYPRDNTPPPPTPSRTRQRKYVLYCRYVAWQVHERVEGEYDFEGENDLVNFTKLAGSLGLLVIIRAGKRKALNGENF